MKQIKIASMSRLQYFKIVSSRTSTTGKSRKISSISQGIELSIEKYNEVCRFPSGPQPTKSFPIAPSIICDYILR